MYVKTYHSRIPHLPTSVSLPVRLGTPCSALKTPNWHHTDEITRIVVLASANGTFSISVFSVHNSGATERMVKYIAKRPAKNMISLESHTMVPTATMSGRLAGPLAEGTPARGD